MAKKTASANKTKSTAKKKKIFKRLRSYIKSFVKKQDKEYSKRTLNKVINNSIAMMWCSYILAWFKREEIAETLSKTIATVVIGVVIPYFVSKTIENVNKYGSQLNGTIFTPPSVPSYDDDDWDNMNRDC